MRWREGGRRRENIGGVGIWDVEGRRAGTARPQKAEPFIEGTLAVGSSAVAGIGVIQSSMSKNQKFQGE